MKCDRCGKEAHYLEECFSCSKLVCTSCLKSSRTSRDSAGRRQHRSICRSCWGKIPARKAFKSK